MQHVETTPSEDDIHGFHKSMDVMLASLPKATPFPPMTTSSSVNKSKLKGPVRQTSDPSKSWKENERSNFNDFGCQL